MAARRRTLLASVLAAAIASVGGAQVHQSDIILTVEAGAIVTNAVIASETVPDRVFTATFGDSGFDGFTANPGFDCVPGTFAVGTRLGFNLRGPWMRWDADASAFVATDENGGAGERLEVSFLTLFAVSADGPVPGFDLAIQSNGGWHRHLDFVALPGAGEPAAAAGVYAMEFELYSTDAGVATSAPFWIVYDLDGSAADVEAAVEHLRAALGPDPCPGDLDASGDVGFPDLLVLLTDWGASGGPADLDASGDVGFPDLLVLLTAWGPCS